MTVKETLTTNKQTIIDAYQAGESTCALGRRYSCSNAAVYLFLRDHGITLRKIKVLDEPTLEAIKNLHLAGVTSYAIAQQLELASTTVDRAVQKLGFDVSHRKWQREDPLVNHKEEILVMYASGMGTTKIAKKFDTVDSSIVMSLQRWGVQLRPIRKHFFNEDFFQEISTQDSAYVLGWFYSDGNVSKDLTIAKLAITDRDILQDIAKVMGYEEELYVRPPQKEGYKVQYSLSLFSRKMCEDLVRVGCVPQKSCILMFPSEAQVPASFHSHFIRGMSDGDGTITSAKGKRWMSRIVGTEAICRGLSDCVQRHLGFKGSVCPVNKGKKHTTWGFSIGGKAQLKTYLGWLYKDADIYLPRKYAKYQEFLHREGNL